MYTGIYFMAVFLPETYKTTEQFLIHQQLISCVKSRKS